MLTDCPAHRPLLAGLGCSSQHSMLLKRKNHGLSRPAAIDPKRIYVKRRKRLKRMSPKGTLQVPKEAIDLVQHIANSQRQRTPPTRQILLGTFA
jgi:hypothetical protein